MYFYSLHQLFEKKNQYCFFLDWEEKRKRSKTNFYVFFLGNEKSKLMNFNYVLKEIYFDLIKYKFIKREEEKSGKFQIHETLWVSFSHSIVCKYYLHLLTFMAS